MDSKSAFVSTIEVPPTPVKTAFFRSRRTRLLLGAAGVFILILIILVPVLDLVYFRRREAPAKLQEDAARYAVIKANFPDPCLIEVNASYYAFATRPLANITLNIQAASAVESISKWTLLEGYDALPVLPAWVKQTGDAGVWAPQVTQRADGTFVMVYSARSKDHPRSHCLGMATSTNVLGPYDPGNSTEPLVCHLELGGIIDPTFLEDPMSNNTYLIYKNDGNAIGSGGACANSNWPNTPTTFQYNTMTQPSWTTFASSNQSTIPASNQTSIAVDTSTIFLHNNRSDGPNIESPQAWFQEYPPTNSTASPRRAYHLLYNVGCFADESYRIEHLVCWLNDTITSFTDCPWQALKSTSTTILLRSGSYTQPDGKPPAVLLAPGGPGITQDAKYMAFHADIVPSWFETSAAHSASRNLTTPGQYTRQRALFIAELEEDYSASDDKGLNIKRLILPES